MVATKDLPQANGARVSLRILLVDDDQEDSFLFETHARQVPGYDVELTWTNDFRDALRIMREQEFDIHFVDFRLGRDSGMELLSRMLEHDPRTAIVLVTGFGDRNVAAESMRRGALDYLSKGELNPKSLLRCFRTCAGATGKINRAEEDVFDDLTGVYRFETFLGAARRELEAEQQSSGHQSVLIVDIDNFQQLAVDHGEDVAQQVLHSVSATVRGCLRRSDMIGRYGTDKVCVLTHTPDVWMAQELAEQIRAAVDRNTVATVSIGIAHAPANSARVNTLVARADAARMLAQQNGRNRIEIVHA